MTFISTPGHGYLKITIKQLKNAMLNGFKPTPFSFFNKSTVLLEEDCDVVDFLNHISKNEEEKKKISKGIKNTHQNKINERLYKSMPETIEELDLQLEFWNLSKDAIGKKVEDVYGGTYEILGLQTRGKKGYLYKNEGNMYVLPIPRIKAII